MERLKDRVAIVTGSGRGMGKAITEALTKEGAWVVICDILEGEIQNTVAELQSKGHKAMGLKVDVTSKARVQQMVQEVKKAWGRIDILVNNAGGALNTPHLLHEIEENHWDLVLNVNLKGAFLCCQAIIPEMVETGGGAIVNISALAAHYRASLAGVQYTAAKAGVEGLTRQLAWDWGPKGIRVNAVAPTVTMTGERVKGLWEQKDEEERKRTLSQIPLRRLGTTQEVAAAVVFLASDEASYITGICLDVVGGRYLR